MPGYEDVQEIGKQLQKEKAVEPVTVREFLRWFGAQRRGFWIVAEIKDALEGAGVATVPDFESAFIDSEIAFELSAEAKKGVPEATPEPAAPQDRVASATSDPTYRISRLAAANKPPLSVAPDTKIEEVVTLLLSNSYSQLPVMTSEREVKGIVSWASIGARLALNKNGTVARDLMDPYVEIRSDASIFSAIPIIVQNDYVIVRRADKEITGIVTASDLSEQFKQLSEPFLLIAEIENHIRRMIGDKFVADELAEACDNVDERRSIDGIHSLNFGEYIRLLENKKRWDRLNVTLDRAAFCTQLEMVREIRNNVVHFDPDGITPDEIRILRDTSGLFQRLETLEVFHESRIDAAEADA